MRPATGLRTLRLAFALAATLVASGAASCADPQSDRLQLLERRLEDSLKMIEALRAQVSALERRHAGLGDGISAREQAAAEPRLVDLERELEQLQTSRNTQLPRDEAGLPLHGFADVGLGYSGEDNARFGRGRKGFSVGTLDLYLTPNFGSRVRSLIEVVVERDPDGGSMLELERAQLGYVFSDALTLWLGRFHNPYGYWNTAFHHGAQLQTSIQRPRFLDFEDMGGILPAHGVGLWATGRVRPGGETLEYDLYVANAPDIEGAAGGHGALEVAASGSESFHAMSGFSLAWSPAAAEGFRVGVHGLRSRVESDLGTVTRLNMLGGFALLDHGAWELIGEGYHFRNQDLSDASGTHQSSAWFVQAAYQIDRLTPFARLERTDLSDRDRYFVEQRNGHSYRRLALGLRYDLDPRAALKFEYDRTTKRIPGDADDRYDEARVQYAIQF